MIDSSENGTNRSNYLKELKVEIYTGGHICKIGGKWGHDSNFCANPVQVLDDKGCKGDSGGPLIAKVRLHFLFIFYFNFNRHCMPVP